MMAVALLFPDGSSFPSIMLRRIKRFVGFFQRIHFQYLYDNLGYMNIMTVTVLFLAVGIIYGLKRREYREAILWMTSIFVPALVFFVCLTTRYYNERYCIFVLQISATLCAIGIYGICNAFTVLWVKTGAAIICALLAMSAIITVYHIALFSPASARLLNRLTYKSMEKPVQLPKILLFVKEKTAINAMGA